MIPAKTYFFYSGEGERCLGNLVVFDGIWLTGKKQTIATIKEEIQKAKTKELECKVILRSFNKI